jgi:hypothetical protein
MTENNDPVAEESVEGSAVVSNSAANNFFAAETQDSTKSRSNFWTKPVVAIAGAAIASGILGFAIGNLSSHEMRPAGISGESFGDQRGQGRSGMPGEQRGFDPDGDNWGGGMMGQPDGRQGGNQWGPGMMGQPGQMLPGQMMPGMPAPHCHDANGNNVASKADGTCADGSQPGFIPPVGPVPSASSSTATQ